MDDKGTEFLASLVGANVDSLAKTTNQLLEMEQAQTRRYASALVTMAKAIEIIPAMQRTVYLDNLLLGLGLTIDAAEVLLSEETS